jgi:pilus assembly protein FimV
MDHAPAGAPVEDSISSDVLSSQWRMDSGLWDEAGTKMDLARAYIEMDDPDAARAILDEVVLEGSESQRAEASALLAKLG